MELRPFSPLAYIKSDADLREYVAAQIDAALAARDAELADARQRIGNLEGMLGQALPYVTKCADMDLADAVACMMLIEHELRLTRTERTSHD